MYAKFIIRFKYWIQIIFRLVSIRIMVVLNCKRNLYMYFLCPIMFLRLLQHFQIHASICAVFIVIPVDNRNMSKYN